MFSKVFNEKNLTNYILTRFMLCKLYTIAEASVLQTEKNNYEI